MDKLLELLKDVCPDIDFENNTELVTGGELDSMDVVTLIGEISDAFDVEIPVEEMIPENFDSLKAIFNLIEKLKRHA